MSCHHEKLMFLPSMHAEQAGYKVSTAQQRLNATTPSGRLTGTIKAPSPGASSFPAPLVLPNDELALDPKYPSQSLRSWIREKDRNEVTPERKTLYVAGPPTIPSELDTMQSWSTPSGCTRGTFKSPQMTDVIEYLEAFYCMPVSALPAPTRFTAWETDGAPAKGKKTPKYVGLKTSDTECVGIRIRPSRDGVYKQQINLDDLLDAAIDILPEDAYALMFLVEQDIYENDDDDFACGRAYGGSRVAVVSMARYHPYLDREEKVPRDHAWPASHCDAYIRECCDEWEERPRKKAKKEALMPAADADIAALGSPMSAAVAAHTSLLSLEMGSNPSSEALSGLWLGRVCKTASHELGHCLGIDHCAYYACIMQGTASLAEDARQPPYLCPVDLAKIMRATNGAEEKHYTSLYKFCVKRENVQLFAAFSGWLQVMMK